MLELLLVVITFLLVLIFFQLKKNIKETDRYFSAIDTSLRQYIAYISNLEDAKKKERHKEICAHLNDISIYTQRTSTFISKDKNEKSIEELYEEDKPQWLPTQNIVK